ncbi:MAG: exodeoxyribonuclease VII small subunit [Bacilli bacterium]|nr:exodeoxyribonuclease VII small subunit [Bacilli bacterium]
MKEKKEKSFEENLVELETIVKKLETGEVPLDDAIEEFNKAMKLAKTCDEKLKKAEETVTKLVKENNELVDFQVEE